MVRVKDIMETQFDLIHGIETVEDALRQSQHLETDCRRNDDDEYGIVLLADIARKILGADKAVDRVNIYEIMSKPVVSVDPDMDIRYCARLFGRFGLTLAPGDTQLHGCGDRELSGYCLERIARSVMIDTRFVFRRIVERRLLE